MKKIIFLILVSTFLSNCSKELAPATPVNLSEVCDAKFDNARDEKNLEIRYRVSFEAYPAFPRSLMLNDTAIIDAYPSPDRQGDPIRVSFKVGSGKNRLKKPGKGYTDSDFMIYDKEGNEIGFNKKVKLEGTRGGSLKDKSCYTSIEVIESLP
ncbi:MAG: hypothetical protein KDK54_16035 [Leptospiraceae bacterium]|nr:hypothetical protein [Leptospiraceae bacterium]